MSETKTAPALPIRPPAAMATGCEMGVRREPSAAGGDSKRAAARRRARRLRERQAIGTKLYRLGLCEDWPSALISLRLISERDARDPEKLATAMADFAEIGEKRATSIAGLLMKLRVAMHFRGEVIGYVPSPSAPEGLDDDREQDLDDALTFRRFRDIWADAERQAAAAA